MNGIIAINSGRRHRGTMNLLSSIICTAIAMLNCSYGNGWPIWLSFRICPMQSETVPVVESLLPPTAVLDSVPCLGLTDQRIRLTAFHPLLHEALTKPGHIELRGSDSGGERSGTPNGYARLVKTGQPVRQLACANAGPNQAPAAAIASHGDRQSLFKAVELYNCRFE